MLRLPFQAWMPNDVTSVLANVLVGQFNAPIANKLFVFAEEVHGLGQREYDQLKSLLTDDWVLINEKNVPAYRIENWLRFLFTTNNIDGIFLDENDRRFFVVNCANRAREQSYYDGLVGWLQDNPAKVIGLLAGMDLASFRPRANAPMTEAKADMIDLSRGGLEAWMRERIDAGLSPFDRPILTMDQVCDGVPSHVWGQANNRSIGRIFAKLKTEQLRVTVNGAKVRFYALRDADLYLGCLRKDPARAVKCIEMAEKVTYWREVFPDDLLDQETDQNQDQRAEGPVWERYRYVFLDEWEKASTTELPKSR